MRRLRAGAPEPVRVLLLHGLGGSLASWERFAGVADERLELWGLELPWTTTGDGTWSRSADGDGWIAEALAAVPGGADVVIAHSFAATLLLEVLTGPVAARPAGVVLGSPFYRPRPEDFGWPTIESYLDGLLASVDEGLRVSAGDRLPADVRAEMAVRIRDRIGPYGWMRFFAAYLRTPMLDVAAMTVPTLVLTGESDVSARPADGAALAAALPDARFEPIARCGHFPAVERPERFAAAVHDFLATLPLGSRYDPGPARAGLTDARMGQR